MINGPALNTGDRLEVYMTLLSDDERNDCLMTIRKAGYSIEDFELKETIDQAGCGEIYRIAGVVIIKHKPTSVSRQYRIGHAAAWLADFDSDLRAHCFDAA